MKRFLENLRAQGNLRRLTSVQTKQKFIAYQNKNCLNLSSNDYLGLTDSRLQGEFLAQAPWNERFLLSNPSSRLMTGNSEDYDRLEASLAALFPGKEALAAGCGYLLNAGILPAVTEKGDLVLADKLAHASLIDGLRLCACEWTRYRHNDLNHLETLLQKAQGRYRRVVVATESVFSMDGDLAPLRELTELKDRYGFELYVDEAHAFGVFGDKGAGLCESLGLADRADYLVATLGKALASQGAFVVCDRLRRDYLVNTLRTLIFSTALPPVSLLWSDFLVRRLPEMGDRRRHLLRLSERLRKAVGDERSRSQIVPVIVGDNHKTLFLAERLREAGYWAAPVRYPTVPQGTARLRVSLCASLTEGEVDAFADKLNALCKLDG